MKLTSTYSLIFVKLMSRKADTPDFTEITRNDIIKVTTLFFDLKDIDKEESRR